MTEEEKIRQELQERFGYLSDAVAIKRKGRIFVDVPAQNFEEVFACATEQMHFDGLLTITGLDTGSDFCVIYHLVREGAIILNMKVAVPREQAEVTTITAHFPNADIYEREISDLLGIKVNGLAQGNRYPLPDNWPANEYPLRKDWKGHSAKKEEGNA